MNNGGILNRTQSHTNDRYETITATNYLSHFLLTFLLIDILKKSAPSRVINIASYAHFIATDMLYNDFNASSMLTSPSQYYLYARSKAAFVMFAKEFNRRYEGLSIFHELYF